MSTMAFACSPASLWGPLFSPQISCDGAATKRNGARDITKHKENMEDLADMHIALIARVLQGIRAAGWGSDVPESALSHPGCHNVTCAPAEALSPATQAS